MMNTPEIARIHAAADKAGVARSRTDVLGSENLLCASDVQLLRFAAAIAAPAQQAEPAPFRQDMPASELAQAAELEKAREDQLLLGTGVTVNGWHVPARLVSFYTSAASKPSAQGAGIKFENIDDALLDLLARQHVEALDEVRNGGNDRDKTALRITGRTLIEHCAALAALAQAPAGVRALTPEEDAATDAKLGIELLPPIRVSSTVAGLIKRFAELEGLIPQAIVRQVLEERFSAQAPAAEPTHEPNAKLMALADRIDPGELWRRPALERLTMPQELQDRLDAGVNLRRYADLLGNEGWRVYPPRPGMCFRASTLVVAAEMAKRDEERRAAS